MLTGIKLSCVSCIPCYRNNLSHFMIYSTGLGNPRGNENPFLLTFGVLWFRYHNYLADEIAAANPGLNDEQVFNLAKKKLIAVYQVHTRILHGLLLIIIVPRHGRIKRGGGQGVRTPPPWNCQIIDFCHVEIFRQTPSGSWTPPPPPRRKFSGSAHARLVSW